MARVVFEEPRLELSQPPNGGGARLLVRQTIMVDGSPLRLELRTPEWPPETALAKLAERYPGELTLSVVVSERTAPLGWRVAPEPELVAQLLEYGQLVVVAA